MAQTILDRVAVQRITLEAGKARPGRALLTLIAALLYGLGWLAAKLVTGIWLVVAWIFTAVRLGWHDAWEAHARQRVRGQVGPP